MSPDFRTVTPEDDDGSRPLQDGVDHLVPSPRDLEAERESLKGTGQDGFAQMWAALNGNDAEELEDVYGLEMLAFMNDFRIMDEATADGGILVRFKDNENYGLNVSPQGVGVAGMTDEQLLTDEGLEAIVEAAIMAKNLPNSSEKGVFVAHSDPTVAMVMKEAAELTGTKVFNPSHQDLAEVDPVLEQRLKAALERVEAKHGGTLPGVEAEAPTGPATDATMSSPTGTSPEIMAP